MSELECDVVKLAIAGNIGELAIALPTFEELEIPLELMEAAAAIVSHSHSDLKFATLELLVRLLVYKDRSGWLSRNPDLAKILPRGDEGSFW